MDLTAGEISGIVVATAFIVLVTMTVFFLVAVKGIRTLCTQRRCHTGFGMDNTMSPKYEVLLFYNDCAIGYFSFVI